MWWNKSAFIFHHIMSLLYLISFILTQSMWPLLLCCKLMLNLCIIPIFLVTKNCMNTHTLPEYTLWIQNKWQNDKSDKNFPTVICKSTIYKNLIQFCTMTTQYNKNILICYENTVQFSMNGSLHYFAIHTLYLRIWYS